MARNLTLKIDDEIYRSARYLAVQEDMSLSSWVQKLITNIVQSKNNINKSKAVAIKMMQKAGDSKGQKWSREEINLERVLK